MTRRARVLCAGLAASVLLAATPASAPGRAGVLATAASRAALPGAPAFVAQLAPGLRAYALPTPRGTTAHAYARRLARRPGVFATQVNGRMRTAKLSQACADVPGVNQGQALATAVGAGAIAAPATTKPVAILDTGVSTDTPELAGRVLPGFNATTGSTDTRDLDGHGTEVAAVAAARPGRFRGISPTSPILPIKTYDLSSETIAAWTVAGIEKAVALGAGVVDLANAVPARDVATGDQAVVDQAITAAFARGVVTIVAAGNTGKSDASFPSNLTRVIAVGSATADGTRDAFSSFGPSVDLVSPGADLVLPTSLEACPSGYGAASGTSFSAPAVAGATALLAAARPALNTQQLFDVVRMGSATDLYQSGHDDDSGFGLLNVATGLGSAASIRQNTEVDDDVFWLKQTPKQHPTLLRTKRTATVRSAVEDGRDPQDVYPVALRRGQTLTVTADAKAGVVGLGVWRPTTGSFDIGAGRTTFLAADSGGVSAAPSATFKVKSAGTYYVSVEAPDPPDRADDLTARNKLTPQARYTLRLRRTTTRVTKAKKRRKASTKKAK